MSRRHRAEKREIQPDPKFGNVVVTKFMNSVMHAGKKSVAEQIVYGAFDIIEGKTKQSPLGVFQQALDNVMPSIEVRSRRVGGATYQVPVEVRSDRRQALGIRWLISAARDRNEKTMTERLSGELLDASNNRGNAVKKREDTHRMAEANRAFSHYRWQFDRGRHFIRGRPHAPYAPDRGLPQLRHHGPHRCREDDDDRADSLLHRQEP